MSSQVAKVDELIALLAEKGVQLWADGDQLLQNLAGRQTGNRRSVGGGRSGKRLRCGLALG